MDLEYEYSDATPSWVQTAIKSVNSLDLKQVNVEVRFKAPCDDFKDHVQALSDLISGIPCHPGFQTCLTFTTKEMGMEMRQMEMMSRWLDSQIKEFRELYTTRLEIGNIKLLHRLF